MRSYSSIVVGLVIAAACGGTTGSIDGGDNDGATNDGTVSDAPSNDGTANDSSADVISLDAAECVPPNTTCTQPCPAGTFCLKSSGPTSMDLGCTTIPPECGGKATCACMADCFCPPSKFDKCMEGNLSLTCSNGTVSRRELKKDITYVDDVERASLAEQTLQTHLAQYRYKTELQSTQRHLGFIIDDMPAASPAVQSDQTHVDLYGYTSMLIATVQEQQKQIDELKKQVDALRRQ